VSDSREVGPWPSIGWACWRLHVWRCDNISIRGASLHRFKAPTPLLNRPSAFKLPTRRQIRVT
jgi:hypothetical protein